jgi:ectoine hydroxylase-related dioxygenase (phytanoyl-CoA dioxygenase family)
MSMSNNEQDWVETFKNDGFVVIRSLFSKQEVEEIRRAFERLQHTAEHLSQTSTHHGSDFVIDREGERTRIHRVVWCGAAESVLSSFGEDPRIVNLAAALLGSPELDQLINQAHFKMPGDNVEFPWHQDSRHRRYGTPLWTDVNGTGSFVEIAMAIDPVTQDNGPIHFIPGSHRLGHIEPSPGIKDLPVGSFDPELKLTPELQPGDIVAFGPYMIHGSEANQSDKPRRMFLNGFSVPGANHRIYPGEGSGRRVRASKPRSNEVEPAPKRAAGR